MKSPFTFLHTAPTETVAKRPALFLLHGMGSDEKDLPQLVTEFKETHHIFSLRGPIVSPPGYAFFTIEEEGKPHQQVFDRVLVYIRQFVEEAIMEYDLDPNGISILGFSQGAVLAQSLALVMGSSLKSVVVLSGYLPDFVKEDYMKRSVEGLAIFISHGEYDYIIPSQKGLESKAYFESLGAKVTFHTYPDGHGVTADNRDDLVEFFRG